MSRYVVAVRLSLSFRSVSEMHGNTKTKTSRLVGLVVVTVSAR